MPPSVCSSWLLPPGIWPGTIPVLPTWECEEDTSSSHSSLSSLYLPAVTTGGDPR